MAKLSTTRRVTQLLDQGRRVSGQYLDLWYLPSPPARPVFMVSKKGLHRAVNRNRARRRVQAIWQTFCQRQPCPGQTVWLVKPAALTASPADLAQEINRLWHEAVS